MKSSLLHCNGSFFVHPHREKQKVSPHAVGPWMEHKEVKFLHLGYEK